MKNALNYYYKLNPTSIHQINKNYKCYVDMDEYVLTTYEGDIEYIKDLQVLSAYLLKTGMPCHQIVFNVNNEIITVINNSKYILLRIFITNRIVTIDDIIPFTYISVDSNRFNKLIKNNWYDMWIKKIDYFEYQISQFGKKYPIVMESANYYIGLAENSVSFLSNNISPASERLFVSHKRINSACLLELFNPLNLVLDNRSRDLAEYIKNRFFNSNYSIKDAINDVLKVNLDRNQYILLFSRLLFPSYYFDKFEEIVHENKKSQELLKIINKNEAYIVFLSKIYTHFIKKFNIIPIEWILKM